MLQTILIALLTFFVGFMGCHYFLAQLWKNTVGVLIVSVVFAIFLAIFVRLAVATV